MDELSEYVKFAEELAYKAGDVILNAFKKDAMCSSVSFKDAVDLVTETDKGVESLLQAEIRKKYPSHLFIGEESVAEKNLSEEVTDDPTWIIDPVDGTTNFVARFPFTCVSIGFAIKKEVVVGVVYSPTLNQFYKAVKGRGAFFNGAPLRVSQKTELKEALVATGFPYDRSEKTVSHVLKNLNSVVMNCRDIRRIGSAALDICHVARGIFDIYYEVGVHAWDVSAGTLIIKEAGGMVADMYDSEFSLGLNRIVVGNPILVPKFKKLLQKPSP